MNGKVSSIMWSLWVGVFFMQCSAGLCYWLKQKAGDALCGPLGWVLCQRSSTCHANRRKAKQRSFAWLMNMLFGWRDPSSFSTSLMIVLPFSVALSLACMQHEFKKKWAQQIALKLKKRNATTQPDNSLFWLFNQMTYIRRCEKRWNSAVYIGRLLPAPISLFIIPRDLRTVIAPAIFILIHIQHYTHGNLKVCELLVSLKYMNKRCGY